MSETLQLQQDSAEQTPDMRMHDVNEAHETAIEANPLENERARTIGGLALVGDVYVDQHKEHTAGSLGKRPMGYPTAVETVQNAFSTQYWDKDGQKYSDNSIEGQNAEVASELAYDAVKKMGLKPHTAKVGEVGIDMVKLASDAASERVAEIDKKLETMYAEEPARQARKAEVESILPNLKR